MRTSLSLVMLALCIVAFECTITANTEEIGRVDNVQSDVVVTKTTTTEAQKPPVEDPLPVQDDKAPAEPLDEDEPEDEEAEITEEKDRADSAKKAPQAPPPAVTTTTNTTENKRNTEGPQRLTQDAHSSSSGSHNPSHNTPPITERASGTPDHSLTARGQKLDNSQLEEVKTTTTEVPVLPPQLLQKGKEKQDDHKSPSEHQTELEVNADERTNIAGPIVSKGPPNTGLQTITQPKSKGEGHSNGEPEGTLQRGVNPPQVVAATTTTSTANKISPKLPAPITDDVLTPQLQAKGSSKTSTGVQNPVTPIKPADPTEGKKQIGAKATTTTTTTKLATVNTESGAALTTSTIAKEKQTASTETLTTSTVAPTTNLPQGFNIPQSLDKMDGSYGTSLLFAFATIVTFIVIAVAPVY